MWSASHRGLAARHSLRAWRSLAGGLDRVHSRWAFVTWKPHIWQIPLSRFLTCWRTYHGLLRIFHSCTHASLQNVRRGFWTSPPHHRQTGSPAAFLTGLPHSSTVTTRRRTVLTRGSIGKTLEQL